ncbi:hypothetical protein U1Q18_030595 [Sarracenia purpurea var. burkii]
MGFDVIFLIGFQASAMRRRQYIGRIKGEIQHGPRGFSTATCGTKRSEGCCARSSTKKVAAKGYLGLGVVVFFRPFWEAVADGEETTASRRRRVHRGRRQGTTRLKGMDC